MSITAKYVHTNLVAKDWKTLAGFYERVFGCRAIGAERNYQGEWINKITGISEEVTIRGRHFLLPGCGPNGPTLEIFEYSQGEPLKPSAANRPGFAHIAFTVDNVEAARDAVLQEGGKDLGEIHSMNVTGAGRITLNYMVDPEGNIIEFQHWDKETVED